MLPQLPMTKRMLLYLNTHACLSCHAHSVVCFLASITSQQNSLFELVMLQVTTVDKYQGQQNDFILLSLVRTQHFGHLRDVRRLVVAMSRSRLGLYVFGRAQLYANCYELQPTFRCGSYPIAGIMAQKALRCWCTAALSHLVFLNCAASCWQDPPSWLWWRTSDTAKPRGL